MLRITGGRQPEQIYVGETLGSNTRRAPSPRPSPQGEGGSATVFYFRSAGCKPPPQAILTQYSLWPGMILPRTTGRQAPVAVGTFEGKPCMVSCARMAKARASLATFDAPSSSWV